MVKTWPCPSILTSFINSFSCLHLPTFRSLTAIVSEKSTVFTFFPQKNFRYQIWPCRKIGQGHSRFIIWTNYDGLESQMLHTKLSGNRPAGSWEDFWRVFTIYGRGGHLWHVTSIMSSDFISLYLKKNHTKFGSDRHSSFWENPVWIFVRTRPWAKVKDLQYSHIFIYSIRCLLPLPFNHWMQLFLKNPLFSLFPIEKPKLKQCFLRKTMSPNHHPLSATLKIMVLNYGDHLSNNILWAEMFIGWNGYGPKWSWTEMVMGRNDPEPLYNMSHEVRKQTLCICENKDAKPISVFVFAKWIVQSTF